MTNKTVTDPEIGRIIDLALAEDRVREDITSGITVPAGLAARAVLQAKAVGVAAGLTVFRAVFLTMDPGLTVELKSSDGKTVAPGDMVAVVTGAARSILAAERVALNFVCHLSGVATMAARYVAQVDGLDTVITDTRKTMPGLRRLEKEAVRMGGGTNHRFNMSDGILIKDNHLAVMRASGLSLGEIVRQAKAHAPVGLAVQVEVTSLAEAKETTLAGADMLLLDNLTPDEVWEIVRCLGQSVMLEASGGINLENVRRYAEAGVARISIGALTHSAPALDFSLELSIS